MARNKSIVLKFLLHLHPPRIPESSARFTHTFGLGGLALFSFLVTAVTGILLVFAYSPTPTSAYESMQNIATVMQYGWYIRNLHYWAAQVMVIAAVLHMIRIVLNGGYLHGRAFNWVIGIVLLVLIILMDFTGYSLRWDTDSNHAMVAGMNLIREIPVIGEFIGSLIAGGRDNAGNTLLRFYGWHIIGLPFTSILFMVYHFYRIRRDGGISGDYTDPAGNAVSGETLLKKEIFFLLCAASALIFLSLMYTPDLGLTVGTGKITGGIRAPWIFLGIQFLLKYFQPFLAGIIIPSAFLLYWVSLPYWDGKQRVSGIWFAAERLTFWFPFILSILIIVSLSIAEIVIK